jgi:uncharacterized protein affecting Mg2+/Co2+ transport
VVACSSFLPHRSRPGQYVFMYQVRIENQVPDTVVKLHSRHWVITDANNFQDQVRSVCWDASFIHIF